jgi:hypothetical protein
MSISQRDFLASARSATASRMARSGTIRKVVGIRASFGRGTPASAGAGCGVDFPVVGFQGAFDHLAGFSVSATEISGARFPRGTRGVERTISFDSADGVIVLSESARADRFNTVRIPNATERLVLRTAVLTLEGRWQPDVLVFTHKGR